jgi:Lrp/AsnC family transcriptional regulator for asnA, asnC and gidA
MGCFFYYQVVGCEKWRMFRSGFEITASNSCDCNSLEQSDLGNSSCFPQQANRYSIVGETMKRYNSSSKKKMLDQIDCRMIELLQKDGRIPNTDIAKEIGISEATVRSRLNRLIEEGFIQIVAVSNPIKLGFKIVGVLRIKVDITKIEKVTKELSKIKSIWFVVHATGDSDIYTEFVARSLDELNDIIFNKVYKIEGIVRTETSLILKYIKRRYDWGTAPS